MTDIDLKTLVAEWLEQNRAALPLNSLHWEPLYTPPPDEDPGSRRHRLGKYEALVQQTDFFYKVISKIP